LSYFLPQIADMNIPDWKVEMSCSDQPAAFEFRNRFEQLFQLYFKPLCFFCQYRFGVSVDEAKDIVHSVYAKLFESQISFISEQSAKVYLYKLTRGTCIDLLRRESLKQHYASSLQQKASTALSIESEDLVDAKQLQEDLHQALEQLPPQMKRIFELSREHGLKYFEIAEALGVAQKTVETQMSRALSRLREKLASYLS
jgi:RNA polymerase sigma-70 factor, ECF subfamily